MAVDDKYDHNQEEANTGELFTANDLSFIDLKKKDWNFLFVAKREVKLPSVVLPQVINEFSTMISHHQKHVCHIH